MKVHFKVIVPIIFLCPILAADNLHFGISATEKREYARAVTFEPNPIQCDDFKYWSNRWFVATIFYDLDGDGHLECLASAPDLLLDPYVYHWVQVRRNSNGKFRFGGDINGKKVQCFCCCPWYIFEVTYGNGKRQLVAHGGYAEEYSDGYRNWMKQGDFIIRTDTNFNFNVQFLTSGIVSLVRQSDFIRFDVISSEEYAGFNQELRCGGPFPLPERKAGTPAPTGFTNFVAHYRAEVKRRLAIDRKVTVYAVFFDADNDGGTDFYVSSDAEKADGDKYLWTLYFADSGKFTKVGTRYRYPPDNLPPLFEPDEESYSTVPLCTLEPQETARKDLFFRYARSGKKPAVTVMDDDGTNLVPRIFMKYVPADDRMRYPPVTATRHNSDYTRENWREDMHGKLGFEPPMDFMDLFQMGFVSLERLPCEEFPEE